MFKRQLERIENVYHDYPRQFWTLVVGSFIDQVGGALVLTFFALYVTHKFGASMTEVGMIFGLYAIAGIPGSILGGALTDRFGRKILIIFGLVASALINVGIGLANSLTMVAVGAVLLGIFGDTGAPARQAMIADMLPEEKRAQAFGLMRVVFNLATAIGPAIGGLLASLSFLSLFIADAATSIVAAVIVALAIRETKPETPEGQPEETVAQTMGGYKDVFRNTSFLLFLGACALLMYVHFQMGTTVGVYLRDTHGIPEQGYGLLVSLNATMVVLLQFPITHWLSKVRPLITLAAGTLLAAIGMGLLGVFASYPLFVVAVVIITIGEMMSAPHAQALAAGFAPEHMRGRYMAIFGLGAAFAPAAGGPLLTGLIMDNFDPRWLWYVVGTIGLVAAAAFALLQRRVDRLEGQKAPVVEKASIV